MLFIWKIIRQRHETNLPGGEAFRGIHMAVKIQPATRHAQPEPEQIIGRKLSRLVGNKRSLNDCTFIFLRYLANPNNARTLDKPADSLGPVDALTRVSRPNEITRFPARQSQRMRVTR